MTLAITWCCWPICVWFFFCFTVSGVKCTKCTENKILRNIIKRMISFRNWFLQQNQIQRLIFIHTKDAIYHPFAVQNQCNHFKGHPLYHCLVAICFQSLCISVTSAESFPSSKDINELEAASIRCCRSVKGVDKLMWRAASEDKSDVTANTRCKWILCF